MNLSAGVRQRGILAPFQLIIVPDYTPGEALGKEIWLHYQQKASDRMIGRKFIALLLDDILVTVE